MLTKRLSRVVLLSILALILHGIEEIWAGFYETYPMFSAIGRLFSSRAEAVFVVYQVMFWIALLTFYALLVSETWRFRLTIAFGALLLYENQHLYYAMQTRRYYPGAITALAILFLDVAFWHEVWRSRRGIPFSSRRGRT